MPEPLSQRHDRRTHALVAALTGLALAGGCRSGVGESTRKLPNVILVDVDTLRYDHVGANDPDFDATPHIDRWARGGVVFSKAYAAAPWTVPSQASLMTSLYPSQHGEGGRYRFCDPDAFDGLAGHLGAGGYATVSFYEVPLKFFTEGFDESRPLERRSPFTFDEPLTWIRAHHAGPFFMLIHTMEVHDYLVKDPHALEATRARFPDYDRAWLGEDVSSPVVHWPLMLRADREDIAFIHGLYQEEIRYVDRQFGRFLHALEEMDLLEETVILLTSDHGEGFDPGRRRITHAGRLHEDLVHVPLIWSGPGLPEGAVAEAPVSLLDVAPTVLALANLEAPATMMGQSLFEPARSWLHRGMSVAKSPRTPIYFEETFFVVRDDGMRVPITRDVRGNKVDLFGLRRGPEKYLYTHAELAGKEGVPSVIDRRELFDVEEDPLETRCLGDGPTEARFESDIQQLRTLLRRVCPGGAGPEGVDPEVLDLLQSLGYVR
jgi:choline-sulfatase